MSSVGYEEQKRECSSRIVLRLLVINDISEYKRLCSKHKTQAASTAAASIADLAYNTELHAFFFQFLLRPVSTEASVKLRLPLAVAAADATAHGERSLPCPPLLRPFVL